MKCSAIYVGKKKAVLESFTKADGTKTPVWSGTRYIFYVQDWTGKNNDECEDLFGRLYTDKREDGQEIEEIEAGVVKVGDKVEVDIRRNDLNVNFWCKYHPLEEKEIKTEQAEIPF